MPLQTGAVALTTPPRFPTSSLNSIRAEADTEAASTPSKPPARSQGRRGLGEEEEEVELAARTRRGERRRAAAAAARQIGERERRRRRGGGVGILSLLQIGRAHV